MKNLIKYMSALAFTGLLTMALSGSVYAQRGGHGGGHGGGGGFHGGGGGVRGGSSFHGGGGFSGGSHVSGGFHGATAFRGGNFRGNAGGFHGAVGARSGVTARNYAYRGGLRAGVTARGGYAYRGGFGGRGYAYRGGRYYYGGRGYYRGGYYGGSRFRFGFACGYPCSGLYYNILPYGYYPFYWNSYPYYYYGGVFYRPYNGGYQVTAPPMGASVPSLPSDAQSIEIDGIQYYESNGVYYQPDVDDHGKTIYVVVGRDGVLNTPNGGGQEPSADYYDPSAGSGQVDARVQSQAPARVEQPQSGITLKVGDVVDQLPDDCRKVTINKNKYYVSPDNIFFEEFKDANGTSYKVASIPAAGQAQDDNQQ